jgi:DNA polymerase-1
MQANGAEILRLACILATEADIRVCAPIHDAVLITAPENEIDDASEAMAKHMRQASRIVLGGFELI